MSIHQRVAKLKDFLSDLYNEKTRLDSILARAGFDVEAILMLGDNHLESINHCMTAMVKEIETVA